MKSIIVYIPVLTLLAGYGWMASNNASQTSTMDRGPQEGFAGISDTVEFDQEKALSELREKIKGQEERPSAEVFENIEVFKKVPAERLLRIMELGFARSLGVDCTHCHNPDDWASEEKDQKQIARDMMAMAAKINNELLPNIDNLESEKPTVNCTTCHRGDVKPAQKLEE